MPVLLAPSISLLIGMAFAWAARGDLVPAERDPWASRALWVVMTFAVLIQAPVTGYFLAYAPDWSYAYLFDTQRLPPAFDVIATLIALGGVPVGYACGAVALRHRGGMGLLRWAALPAALTIALGGTFARRWATKGTYAQFHGHFGVQSLGGSDIGYAILWMTVVTLLAVIVAWVTLRNTTGLGSDH